MLLEGHDEFWGAKAYINCCCAPVISRRVQLHRIFIVMEVNKIRFCG